MEVYAIRRGDYIRAVHDGFEPREGTELLLGPDGKKYLYKEDGVGGGPPLARRLIAGFRMLTTLGVDTPVIYAVSFDGRLGSLQPWREAPDRAFLSHGDIPGGSEPGSVYERSKRRLLIADSITGETDRRPRLVELVPREGESNCLVDPADGHLIAVDGTYAFVRSRGWGFDEDSESIAQLRHVIPHIRELEAMVAPLLVEFEPRELRRRFKAARRVVRRNTSLWATVTGKHRNLASLPLRAHRPVGEARQLL